MQDIYLLTSLTNFKNSIDKTTKAKDDVLRSFISQATMEAENYTKRNLRARTYGANGLDAEIHNGNGQNTLYTKEYPIISVTELYDDTVRNFTSTTLKASTDYIIWRDEGMIQLYDDALLGSIFDTDIGNVKLIYTAGYEEFNIISGVNNYIDFEEVANSQLSASVSGGRYTASGLCSAVKTALDAAGTGSYTVVYDYLESKFRITSDMGSGRTFKIRWSTGSNRYRSIARRMGFYDDSDNPSKATHIAERSALGIPDDLETAVLMIAKRKLYQSEYGGGRFDIKQKSVSGDRGMTTTYVGGDMPEEAKRILDRYARRIL